jgi:hypothetical protein
MKRPGSIQAPLLGGPPPVVLRSAVSSPHEEDPTERTLNRGSASWPSLPVDPPAAVGSPFWPVLFAARLRRRTTQLHRAVSSHYAMKFPPMTIEQERNLSPWDKWNYFNRFPFKFVLQVLLLGLVSLQTWFYASQVLPYFNQSTASFVQHFYGFTNARGQWQASGTAQLGSRGINNVVRISTIPEFASSVQSTYLAYASYLNTSIDGYASRPALPSVRGEILCDSPPPDEAVPTFVGTAGDLCAPQHAHFELTAESPYGPFNPAVRTHAEWRQFFDRVKQMTLTWVLIDISVDFLSHYGLAAFEVEWTISATYSFASAGQMQITYASLCDAPLSQPDSARNGSGSTAPLAAAAVDYSRPIPMANVAQECCHHYPPAAWW